MQYVAPSHSLSAFNCPHCAVLASQQWHLTTSLTRDANQLTPGNLANLKEIFNMDGSQDSTNRLLPAIDKSSANRISRLFNGTAESYSVDGLFLSECYNCKKVTIWILDKIFYPNYGQVPNPNPDTPQDIIADYREASAILSSSPRGAAALLRLAIQKLCIHLGQPGKNINQDIKSLVSNGLPASIQKALDIVRVTGNEAVHPGVMNIEDDSGVAHNLFGIFNFIVEKMISEPKKIDEIYTALPPEKLAQIEARDRKQSSD